MVCYQQLAGAAARTIHGRFEALFTGAPTPEAVLAVPETSLRGAGLSAAKAASIRDLAMRVEAGDVRLARIGRFPDDEVVRQLVTGAGHRPVDGGDVPHVPAAPPRRVAGRRPRRAQGVRPHRRDSPGCRPPATSSRWATGSGPTARWGPGTAGARPTPSSRADPLRRAAGW